MTELASLPGDPVAVRALALADAHVRPAIRNHSVRTYLHAELVAARLGVLDYRVDLLFMACVLHDIGTADAYDGTLRFEVDGADGAAAFLTDQGLPAGDVDQVWEAIALHTSPHIAERRGPVTMLTRRGVLADFGAGDPADTAAIESELPRLDVERELAAAIVAQALRNPDKAPASTWPGGLLRAHQEGGRAF
jgi:hypothetical protein